MHVVMVRCLNGSMNDEGMIGHVDGMMDSMWLVMCFHGRMNE